jgi:prepilin-type N-terminal cleavage/methylation domain-containing protein
MKNEPNFERLSRETSACEPCPNNMHRQSGLHRATWDRQAWDRRAVRKDRPAGKSVVGSNWPARRWRSQAFTFIELLVVIAIIGVLTALVISAAGGSGNPGPKIAVAQAELEQMASAIQEYKDTLGFYPPDNPLHPEMNPLWFELLGTTNNGINYITLDHAGQISATDINTEFGRQGFANTAIRARATDEAGAPVPFLKNLRPAQTGDLVPGNPLIKVLVCSVQWPEGSSSQPISGTTLNPWRYVSTHPTNNTGSYDLWVDLVIGKKIYRVSNWNKKPQIIP